MKTTVEIADALLDDARKAADKEGTTVRALIEEGLRLALKSRRQGETFRLRDGSFKGKGLSPEFRDAGWEAIREAAYSGRGG